MSAAAPSLAAMLRGCCGGGDGPLGALAGLWCEGMIWGLSSVVCGDLVRRRVGAKG